MSRIPHPLLKSGPLFILKWHWLRLCLDFQYGSIVEELKRAQSLLASPPRQVLDFGAGLAPWRRHFQASTYTTIDLDPGADFRAISDLPADFQPDLILLLEVLEHLRNPEETLSSLRSRIRENGELWVSVPFQARVHACPEDYQRWAPAGLQRLLESSGWRIIEMRHRGSDWTLLGSKWIVFLGRRLFQPVTLLPAAIFWILTVPVVVMLGWLSMKLRWGFEDEALGWFVRAERTNDGEDR